MERSGSSNVLDPLPIPDMEPAVKEKFDHEISRAEAIVCDFFSPVLIHDQSISRELLHEAHGLLFISVYKAGFLFSAKFGKGFVIAKTSNGWSSPWFIRTGGMGFGMMAGAEKVNYMVILGSRGAVNTFTRNGQIQIGSELDIAIGPIGRAAAASVNVGKGGICPNYSYSHAYGLYGGIGLSSAILTSRETFNRQCYGYKRSARDVLSGAVIRAGTNPLWLALDKAMGKSTLNSNPMAYTTCHECNTSNVQTARECVQCDALLIFSKSTNSGNVRTGKLISTETVTDL